MIPRVLPASIAARSRSTSRWRSSCSICQCLLGGSDGLVIVGSIFCSRSLKMIIFSFLWWATN